MTPYERLLAEAIPTRPTPPPEQPQPSQPRPTAWTAAEQDRHWNDLCDAIAAPHDRRPGRLHLVEDTAA